MDTTRHHARLLAVALVAALVGPSVATAARAGAPPDALSAEQVLQARTSFKDGLALEKDGKWEPALAKFRETAAIKQTPQVRFHIALCEEKLLHYLDAIADFEAAGKDAAEKNVAEVAKAAPKLADDLRPLVPKLSITFPVGRPPRDVTLDGRALDVATLSAPILVDPGPHVVTATNGAGKEARLEVSLAEREERAILMPLEAMPAAQPPATKTVTTTTTSTTPLDAAPRDADGARRRTFALVLGGVGVASLGVAVVFTALRSSKVSSLESSCVDLRCPPASSDDLDAARRDTTISRVALGVGVVSLGVGAVLFFTGKPRSETSAVARPSVSLVPQAPGALVGLGFQGAF